MSTVSGADLAKKFISNLNLGAFSVIATTQLTINILPNTETEGGSLAVMKAEREFIGNGPVRVESTVKLEGFNPLNVAVIFSMLNRYWIVPEFDVTAYALVSLPDGLFEDRPKFRADYIHPVSRAAKVKLVPESEVKTSGSLVLQTK